MSTKTFCPHGMPPLMCIKCQQQRSEPPLQAFTGNLTSPLLAKAPVTQAPPPQAQAAAGSGFDITQIPAIMDKLGAVQGPRFMRRWFNGPAFELPMDFKTGRKDARLLDKAHRMEDLPFEWLEKSKRVGPTVKSVVEELLRRLRVQWAGRPGQERARPALARADRPHGAAGSPGISR
ncbi:DUF6402 family protein [Archangium gephyra]|uniref:DUF6402 family protein n=1 Tax=Archangium gephyra TaxID=48 RepID=UPI003B7F9F00